MTSGSAPPFAAGDTFLIKGANSEKLHLYIVLCGDPPSLIAVPLNTVTILTDRTVLLQPGDHPFINRATSVSYDLMHLFDVGQLLQLEGLSVVPRQTLFERREAMRADILKRLVDGARTSDMAPKKMIKALEARLGGGMEPKPRE